MRANANRIGQTVQLQPGYIREALGIGLGSDDGKGGSDDGKEAEHHWFVFEVRRGFNA